MRRTKRNFDALKYINFIPYSEKKDFLEDKQVFYTNLTNLYISRSFSLDMKIFPNVYILAIPYFPKSPQTIFLGSLLDIYKRALKCVIPILKLHIEMPWAVHWMKSRPSLFFSDFVVYLLIYFLDWYFMSWFRNKKSMLYARRRSWVTCLFLG